MIEELYQKLKKLNITANLVDGQMEIRAGKGVLNDALLNEIRDHKQELIDFLAHYRSNGKFSTIISKAPVESDYPVSSSQRRMWVLNQLEESSVAYNVPGIYVFTGNFDRRSFAQAFSKLIERHEILRTVFRENDQGDVRQYIQPPEASGLKIVFTDLRRECDLAAKLDEAVKRSFTEPFNLSSGPLLRAILYQVEDDRWVFGYVMHHIISDGWSTNILIAELFQFYEAFRSGQPALLKPLAIQYKDYAVWQRHQLSDENLQEHKSYWLQQFEGTIPVLEIPTDHSRPHVKTFAGAICRTSLDKAISQDIRKLSQQQGCTLFMSMLATVNALLYRYTGQEDIVIGSPINARDHADLQGQIGFYVNTLALRTRFNGGDSFRQLLGKVKQVAVGAYKHQSYPFDELVNELQLKRDMSRNPLFDVMVTGQEAGNELAGEAFHFGEIEVSNYECSSHQFSKFDLNFSFGESEDLINVNIEYSTDLFEKNTIEKLLIHFSNLIKELVGQPDVAIDAIDYLSKLEKHQLLEEFNSTKQEFPSVRSVTELFERQVLLTPGDPALVFEQKQVRYEELNNNANRLSHYLKSRGIKPGDAVGLCMERGINMVTGILSIQKAGCAYIPIDPSFPVDRIQYILSDSGTPMLLTNIESIAKLGEQSGVETVLIDEDISIAKNEKIDNPVIHFVPDHLAYVMYTSGSTGQPKGVEMYAKSLVNLLYWQQEQFGNVGQRRILQFAGYGFDVSFQEIFSALCFGGCLYLLKETDRQDMGLLQQLLNQYEITHLFAPFVLLDRLSLQFEESKSYPKKLKEVITAGEQLKITPAIKELIRITGSKLVNQYGPTEAHVVSSYEVSFDKESKPAELPPIGKPNANNRIYILGSSGQLQPVGVAGEICIAGAGLAKGYLNKPELTAQKFTTLFSKTGERVYRTGDVGRWLSDGNIEFLGRTDDQVKIRGYRVELGEIENCLQQHPSISSAVVVARQNAMGGKELISYIVSKQELDSTGLRAYLSRTLPEYMIPVHFVQLDALPVNTNGKVDRKRLPDPFGLDMQTGVSYIAPRNEVEQKLVSIWSKVLGRGVEKISVRDNFFTLGGHSLKATRLSSHIHREFGSKPSLRELFTHATIEQQAALLQGTVPKEYKQIEPVALSTDYAVSPSQRRLWVLSRFRESSIAYNLPGVHELQGSLSLQSFSRAFDTLMDRHEILRTVFKENEQGELRQYVLNTNESNFSVKQIDLRLQEASSLSACLRSDATGQFNLSEGPLVRATLYRTGEDKWVFSYVMHHIISDGWSMEILIRELLELYNAYLKGEENPLKPLRIQYKDYAAWQQQQAFEEHKNYWLDQFGAEPSVLDLPGDRLRPAVKTYNGTIHHSRINKENVDRLRTWTREQNCTLFMALLAVVKVLLYRYTGQEDITIGSPVAGREHADLDDQIGFYINTLALRTRFSGNESSTALLEKIKQVSLDGYKHQLYPFDELVDELKLHRDMSRHPLFDVMVVLQNTRDIGGERPQGFEQLNATGYNEATHVISKFDLNFNFIEAGETIEVGLEYNTDIYSAETAGAIARHFEQLLESMTANPQTSLSSLQYLDAKERYQLLESFNDTAAAYPEDKTLVDLFEEQAGRTPGNIALVYEQTRLSYAELNEKSNQLAHYLRRQKGVRAGELIGMLLERSEWMIISVLGILKSGGAYVPIDPEYPQQRIDYMVRDSGCRVVINEELLREFKSVNNNYSKQDPVPVNQPSDLAYVIYTSGSTGTPKGAMVRQNSCINLVSWYRKLLELKETDNVLLMAPIGFDLAQKNIFTSLVTGSRLVLPPKFNSSYLILADTIARHKVTILNSAPSAFYPLLDADITGEYQKLVTLRKIILGGEPIAMHEFKAWMQSGLYNAEVINSYGPTECSDVVSSYTINIKEAWNLRTIPVGKAIDNVKLYVLDNNHQLVAQGIPGEICIGGTCVGNGYLNNEGLTEEKFINNPFKENETIYKTGDLGKWLADGNIEFLGRKDEQFKIRGYRVEPGEIEACIQRFDNFESAIVIARENREGYKELIAYMVSTAPLNRAALRAYLGRHLPGYMIPSNFVQLDALPLNSNGKIDRKALPLPDASDMDTRMEYFAPKTFLEEKICSIWSRILGIKEENIGTRTDFFALGGHSLKAIRLASLIHKEMDILVELRDLFSCVTIEEQAQFISQTSKNVFVAIEPVEVSSRYPLSSAQHRLWILSQYGDGNAAYNMPGVCVFEGEFDYNSLCRAFEGIIDRHEILRTVFRQDNQGEVWQEVLSREELGFSIGLYDLSRNADCELRVKELVQQEMQRPFDLTNGPLLRGTVYKLSPQRHVFSYNLHHIISDGWSMDILLKELLLLYNANLCGETLQLAPLRIHYKDYSSWQQQQLRDTRLGSHKQYWLDQFIGTVPVLELAGDHARPAVKSYNGRVLNRKISKEHTTALRTLSYQQGGTLFMGLLAVIKALLYRYTGQTDIVIGSPVAGRNHADLEEQIGFYVNMLALRTRFNGDDSFKQMFRRVKEITLNGYAHQDYPFDELVNEVHQSGDKSRHALFDVVVVLQNTQLATQPATTTQQGLGGMEVKEFEGVERRVSLFDLRFDFHEEGEMLQLVLEYNSDIYNRQSIERLGDNLEVLLGAALKEPDTSIGRLDYISQAEKEKILLASPASYPKDKTIVDLFEEQVRRWPMRTAVTCEGQRLSYEELNKRSNQLSQYLAKELKLQPQEGVALLVDRNIDSIVSMLGILKAGGMYLPMETDLPEERLKFMLRDAGVRILITGKQYIELANRLQWSSKQLESYICIDSENVYAENEQENVMMNRELWDHVGTRAVDQVTGGGWSSSYTGAAIPTEEMEEYAMNAYKKLSGLLHKQMRVLEIGCSSGLTLEKVAPHVGFFYGTDLSAVILDNTAAMLETKGIDNVRLRNIAAHELNQIEEKDFDLIIINSVIQHFHGHNYLIKVIEDAIKLLGKKGYLFIGDVMDMDCKEEMITELEAFRLEHQGKGYVTKTDFSADLFVSRDFFHDLCQEQERITGVEISEKIRTIENELTKFRYDALLSIDKTVKNKKRRNKESIRKKKRQISLPAIARCSTDNLQLKIRPDQLAYIIYTSGTTGNPKGVLIEHRNVVRLFQTDRPLFDFTEKDVWTMFHSYSFDFSVWEMYGALLYGGKLVVVPKHIARDPQSYLELLYNEKVSILNQTPSAFYNLQKLELEQEQLDGRLDLHYVIFGGEALSPSRLSGWRARYPEVKLINMYGITETTVHVTYKEITEKEIQSGISNIGIPIPTLSCYVLDDQRQQVAIGVAGELYVGGEGVGRGYLNRPELTAQRFIDNPFEKGERLYRSGDKVRLLHTGELEYAGRKDDQVKIRGFRIELAEIESTLQQHPDIESTVVIPGINSEGERELVGYIVGKENLLSSDLRAYLGIRLPDYMIPAHFVQLSSMPLTVNGKVDKKALPELGGSVVMATGVEFIAPRTETEERLVQVWSKILGVSEGKISVKDDFFTLGGHSLKATRLVSHIHKTFDVKIALRDIFSKPTVETMAMEIDTALWMKKEQPAEPATADTERLVF